MEQTESRPSADLSCSPENVIGLYSSFLNNKGMLKRKFPSNGSLSKVSLAFEKESSNNVHKEEPRFLFKSDMTLSECKSLMFKYHKLFETKERELEEVKRECQIYAAENEKIIKQYYELEQVVKNTNESSKKKDSIDNSFCITEKKSQVTEFPIRSRSLRKNSYQTEEDRIYELEQENSNLYSQLEVLNKEKNNLENENHKVISKLHTEIESLQKDVDESHEQVAELKETKATIEKKFRLSQVSKIRRSNRRKTFDESKVNPPIPSPGSSLISIHNFRKVSILSDESDSGSDRSSSSVQLRKKIEELTQYNQYLEVQTCEAEKKIVDLEKKIQNKDQLIPFEKRQAVSQPVPVALNYPETPTCNGSKRGRFFSSLDSFRSSIASVSSVFNTGSLKHPPNPSILSPNNITDIPPLPTFPSDFSCNRTNSSNVGDEFNQFVEPEKRKDIVQWIQNQPDLCSLENNDSRLDNIVKQEENICSFIESPLFKKSTSIIETALESDFYNSTEFSILPQSDKNPYINKSEPLSSIPQKIIRIDNNCLSIASENSYLDIDKDKNTEKHLEISSKSIHFIKFQTHSSYIEKLENFVSGPSLFNKNNPTPSSNTHDISDEELSHAAQHNIPLFSDHYLQTNLKPIPIQKNRINVDPAISLNSKNEDSSLLINDCDYKNPSPIYNIPQEPSAKPNLNNEKRQKVSFINHSPTTTAERSRRIDLSNIVHPSISKYIKQFNGRIISNNYHNSLNNFDPIIPESSKKLFKHSIETPNSLSDLENKLSNSSTTPQTSLNQNDFEAITEKKEYIQNPVYMKENNVQENEPVSNIFSPHSPPINKTVSNPTLIANNSIANKKNCFNNDNEIKKANYHPILEQPGKKNLIISKDSTENFPLNFQKPNSNLDQPSIDFNITNSTNIISSTSLSTDKKDQICNFQNYPDAFNVVDNDKKNSPRNNQSNSKKRIPINSDSFTQPSLKNPAMHNFNSNSSTQAPNQPFIQLESHSCPIETEDLINESSQTPSIVYSSSFQRPSQVLFSQPTDISYSQEDKYNDGVNDQNPSFETKKNLQCQANEVNHANSPPINIASTSNLTRKIEASRETDTLDSNFHLNHSVHDQFTSDSDESSFSFARPKPSSISSSSFDPSDTRKFSSLRPDFNSENYPPIGSRERFFRSRNQTLITSFNHNSLIRSPNSILNHSQMSMSSVTTAIQSYCLSNPPFYHNFPRHLPNYNDFEHLKRNFNIHIRRREPFGITSIIRYCILSFIQWIQFLILLVLAVWIALIRGPHRHFQDSDSS